MPVDRIGREDVLDRVDADLEYPRGNCVPVPVPVPVPWYQRWRAHFFDWSWAQSIAEPVSPVSFLSFFVFLTITLVSHVGIKQALWRISRAKRGERAAGRSQGACPECRRMQVPLRSPSDAVLGSRLMSDQDAFARIVASFHEAMLDDTRWPTTSTLIDDGQCPVGWRRPAG